MSEEKVRLSYVNKVREKDIFIFIFTEVFLTICIGTSISNTITTINYSPNVNLGFFISMWIFVPIFWGASICEVLHFFKQTNNSKLIIWFTIIPLPPVTVILLLIWYKNYKVESKKRFKSKEERALKEAFLSGVITSLEYDEKLSELEDKLNKYNK